MTMHRAVTLAGGVPVGKVRKRRSALVRALDARDAPPVAEGRRPPHVVMAPQDRTIRQALEWAFGVERASLDFAEDKGDNVRPGVSPIWVLMQRGALGCKVDGGGWSEPARDADIIASAVAHLPQALGGRGMALRIAELARAGLAEDWGADLRARCVPVAWKGENQFGRQADTVLIGVEKVRARGRVREIEVRACPVTFTATAERIAAARAGYLAWRRALSWLGAQLAGQVVLDRVVLVPGLPDAEPWVRVA